MFRECPSTCASLRMLFTNVSKILAEENVFSYTEFSALNPAELVEIVLFGHTKLSKSPSLRLLRQTCLFLSRNTPFQYTCYDKFPFNFKLVRSVLTLSVAVVSALSARRLAWLLRFVCVLAFCGGQLVSGFVWKRVYFGLTDDDEVI